MVLEKKGIKNPEETKKAIREAFWTFYKEKSINDITIKAITTEAGFYRSTFYLHYSDIYQILEEIEKEVLEAWQKLFFKITNNTSQDTYTSLIANFYESHGEYLSVLLGPQGDPKFTVHIKTIMKERLFTLFEVERPHPEDHLLFEFFSSGMLGLLSSWYAQEKPISAKEVAQLVQILLRKGPVLTMMELHPHTLGSNPFLELFLHPLEKDASL